MKWLLVILAACGGKSEPFDPGTGTETDTEPPTTTDVPTTVPTTEDTDVPTDPPDPCGMAPGMAVLTADVARPWHENEVEIAVTLSQAATLAVQCTLQADPTEIHLVESAATATDHTVRIAGLLGGTTYDCVAAPVCPTVDGEPLAFTIETQPANPILPNTKVVGTGGGTEYILANHSDDCAWKTQRLVIFDRMGRSRWWYSTPEWVGPSVEFRYHGLNQLQWGGGWEANSDGRPRKLDLFDGQVYDSALAMPDVGDSEYHHDGKQLADGRLLTLEEVEVRGGDGDWFTGFQVRRVDPVTNLVDFTYDSQRAVDEGHLPEGFGDAWHANWMDIAIVDGREVLAVSFCFLQQVAFVDVATGDWLGLFGANQDFSLTDAGGAPLGPDGFSQCQHGLEFTGSELLVYDNGVNRGASRASEYSLDFTTFEAVRLWTWTEPDWYESTLGDVDYLPSGNILVGMGHAECFSSNPGDNTTIVEIDPVAGAKLWEMKYTVKGEMAYRADFADACTLFANAAYCPEVATRLAELALAF